MAPKQASDNLFLGFLVASASSQIDTSGATAITCLANGLEAMTVGAWIVIWGPRRTPPSIRRFGRRPGIQPRASCRGAGSGRYPPNASSTISRLDAFKYVVHPGALVSRDQGAR